MDKITQQALNALNKLPNEVHTALKSQLENLIKDKPIELKAELKKEEIKKEKK